MAGRIHVARRLRELLLASAAVPLFAALPAAAQDAPPPQTDAADPDIVVTGIRETLQTSIQQKKQETAIVDTLSSSEIGDLPALSVGEAIQTITGATTHREKGGASEIALRGLGSFLSNTTFNGREATNGSGDRAVNFNQFPSELINGIKIYKSQQANLVEGGVAGTIELETLKPLDFKNRRVQAEIKGNYSPYQDRVTGSDATGYRATFSYVDQFDAGGLGRVGIALGFQRNQTNNPEETLALSTTWTACKTIVVPGANCTPYARADYGQNLPFYLVPNSITYRQISETDRRDAFFVALQWQPSSTLEFNFDTQYSDRKYVENRHDLNISEALFGLTNVVSNADHVVTKLNGLSSLESTNAIVSRAEEYLGYGLAVKWRPTPRLTITADGSYSRTIRTEIERNARLRTDPLDVNGTRNFFATAPFGTSSMRVPYTYEVLPGNFAPTITIDPRFDLTNHNLFWDDARMRRDENQRRNEIKAVRADIGYDFDGFLSKISAGGRYVEQTYSDYDDRKEANLNPAIAEDRRINQLCRQGAFPARDFLKSADGNTISRWATFDGDCLFREYVGSVDPGPNADLRYPANRDVTETTYAGYLMGDYKGDIGSLGVRGNFGVRVVRTETVSNGLRSDLDLITNPDGSIQLKPTGAFQTVTIETTTTRVLPSVNAVFEPTRNTQLRLAGYRGMSRPAPSSLGFGRTLTLPDGASIPSLGNLGTVITANGSPRLEPLMSWNVDAALEWYPNRDTILAATLYHKWFTGGFIPVQVDEQFTIEGQSVTVPIVQTQNDSKQSTVYGLEVTAATRFSFLPKPLDGFGGKVSYNYAISDFENEDIRLGDSINAATGVITQGIIPPANLSGYSKHVVSAQLYYQIGGLNLSGVYNYRSKYYQDFVGGNSQLRYVRGNETVDLRASYDISKVARIQFEAVNIFDSPKVTDMPVEGGIRQFHYYGSRYFLGLRVRL